MTLSNFSLAIFWVLIKVRLLLRSVGGEESDVEVRHDICKEIAGLKTGRPP